MFHEGDEIGPYELTKYLGHGGFGKAWLAKKRTPLVTLNCVLKIPRDINPDLHVIRAEASIWQAVTGHVNILPIIDAGIYGNHLVIVSEYVSEGSLETWIETQGGKAPSISSAAHIMLGVLSGLAHLHSRKVIHRDLKPANILLQGDTPRLTDFGLSRALVTSIHNSQFGGSVEYMAP